MVNKPTSSEGADNTAPTSLTAETNTTPASTEAQKVSASVEQAATPETQQVNIGLNTFAERHTAESKYSHFEGSPEELIALVQANFENKKQGYTDGVWEIPVPAEKFRSGVCKITEDTELRATFAARRKGEDPYVQLTAIGGEKMPAKAASIIVYSKETLGDDATTDQDFEIVSINARPTEEPEPMTPMAMARNLLEGKGGTKATYTAEQLANSIVYWNNHVMIETK